MKRIGLSFYFIFTCFALLWGRKAGEEHLLLCGSGWNKIVIFDKSTGQIEWEHPLKRGWECNSVDETPDGNILFAYARGAMVVDRQHREIWNIQAPKGCEMQCARVLPNGNSLLGWCGHPSVIMEVDKQGKILSQTEYETGIAHPHSQFRQLNKTPNGNYLMPLFATSEVREIDPKGNLVKTYKLEGTPFTTLLKNKRYCWVACGDGHSLVLLDMKTAAVVARYGEKDLEDVRLFFVAGLCPASKGGLYICNWQGHGGASRENVPQIVEMDKKGRVVWRLTDKVNIGMVSDICVLKHK